MRTRGNTQYLSKEESKGLLYVKARAHYPAFYHQAILPALVPRLWSINYGESNGEIDKADWFKREGLLGLALLAAGDAEALNKSDEHTKAEARRAVIFNVDRTLFRDQHLGVTDSETATLSQICLENAYPV